jgi:transcriptional regulator with XRE-family HTH domain
MELQRIGAIFRAVRIRKGWRQAEVARTARVSISTVSRIERGLVGSVSVGTMLRIAAALEIRIDWVARWRGGELDRMLSAGHAAMHDAAAELFRGTEWLLAPEATFSVYGERGVIDILAFHPPTGSLLVIELKTDLVDVQALLSSVDRYRRLGPVIARERGWEVRTVSCWVALRDTRTNRRRVAAHAAALRTTFPADGRRVGGWLTRPDGVLSALSFLPDSHRRTAIAASSSVQRVRRAS